jgi:hypothetical protein
MAASPINESSSRVTMVKTVDSFMVIQAHIRPSPAKKHIRAVLQKSEAEQALGVGPRQKTRPYYSSNHPPIGACLPPILFGFYAKTHQKLIDLKAISEIYAEMKKNMKDVTWS